MRLVRLKQSQAVQERGQFVELIDKSVDLSVRGSEDFNPLYRSVQPGFPMDE